MSNSHHPYHPIIYVRGFAMLQSEIEETVADPYMGFNIGATKARTLWTGKIKKFFFESPLVRLMREKPTAYNDVYVNGDDALVSTNADYKIPYQCVIIFRYYDEASEDFGTGSTPAIQHFARGLSELILQLRNKICANPDNAVNPDDFRVYLVAHSMGGLVCRAFLQNPALGDAEARKCVDKFFTYATPHNGIDLRIVRNVPAWVSFGDANNFNREKMAEFFALPPGTDDVSQVKGFPPERIFNLVGTNPADYAVARGLSSWAVGDASDGLVRITNATTFGRNSAGERVPSPSAFAYRSHSGQYGIVNSEEGYQNLTRFLFGKLRVDGFLDIDQVTFPAEIQSLCDSGKNVTASYQFEIAVSVRGQQWQIHRRAVRENSAIFRQFDELFPKNNGVRAPDRTRSPHLFSVFLDPTKSVRKDSSGAGSVSFALDLNVQVPDYEVDGALFLKQHYEGGYIYRDLIIIEAFPDNTALEGWLVKYGYQDRTPNLAPETAQVYELPGGSGIGFALDVLQPNRPGITAKLRFEARSWNIW